MIHSNEHFFIEPRARGFISPDTMAVLEAARKHGGRLVLSGQPVMMSPAQLFHYDCEPVFGQLLLPTSLRIRKVPEVGHNHIPPRFVGEFAVLAAIDPESGTETVLGIREELGFEVHEPGTQ